MDHPTFGRWLKLRRRSLGLTQAQLGEQIGYAGETIRKVEADELRPSRQMAEKLAKALEIAPEEQAAFVRFARDEASRDEVALPVQIKTSSPPPFTSPTHITADLLPREGNLPLPRDPLLGREWEVAVVQNLLLRPTVGLVTLTGPGGVGKSRLALQVAANLLSHATPETGERAFPAGVYFVPLASLDDPTLVLPAIAQTLNVREAEGQPLLSALQEHLRDQQLLLVLDNFEQVVAAAPLLGDLLQAAPRLKILVTSRTVLHLREEQTFAVPPLTLPALDTEPGQVNATTDPAQLLKAPAVQLFIERAQSAQADFAVTSANARTLAEICHHLDGLPLAIELAAARVRLLPPQAMLTRLAHPLQLLTNGARNLPTRHQTMRATLAWSCALLDEAEKTLFRQLAVFAGGGRLEAIEAVCSANRADAQDRLDVIASLLDKSLLQQQADVDGEPRFRLLRVVREYALEQLEEHGEAEAVRRRYAAHFLALAEQAEPELMGAAQQVWLDRLALESNNLRAALDVCLAEHDIEMGLRFGGALWRFWEVRGYLDEGRLWLERLLAKTTARTSRRAKVLAGVGRLACNQGDYAAARRFHEESLSISQELGDLRGIAFSLNNLGNVAFNQGDYAAARLFHEESLAHSRQSGDQRGTAASLNNLGILAVELGDYEAARTLHAESLALKRTLGDKQGIAASLNNLGNVALNQGDYEAAFTLHTEGLALKREVGDRQGIATSLNNLGNIALTQGDYRTARPLLEESLVLQKAIGNRRGAALALCNLGDVAYHEGDSDTARALYTESLSIRWEVGDKQGIAECFVGLAGVARMVQLVERAARLLATTEALLEAIGSYLEIGNRVVYENHVAAVKRALGEEPFAAAWAAGRAMTLEQAVADALALSD